MKLDLTRDEVIEIITQHLLIQEGRDAEIRDEILNKYEDEPYYETLMDVCDDLGQAYFKLGIGVADLLKG